MRAVRSFIGTLVLASASALAADGPTSATPNADTTKRASPPAEDPIAAAKRDLAAIKDAKSGIEQRPKGDLGAFSGSDLTVGTQAPWLPTAPKSAAEAAAAKKSANWLVDAMMKKPATRGTDGRTRVEDKAGTRDKNGDGLSANGDDVAGAASARDEIPSQRENAQRMAQGDRSGQPRGGSTSFSSSSSGASMDAGVNPLTSFMATWMTPQDYKLLQSGLKNDGGGEFGNKAGGGAPLGAQVAASEASIASLGRTVESRPMAGPRENPFLQDYASAATSPAQGKATASAAPVAGVAAPPQKVFTPPPEAVPQKPTTPAFVKPNDDAKYFKPLKRF